MLYILDQGEFKHVGDWNKNLKSATFEDIDEARENNWIVETKTVPKVQLSSLPQLPPKSELSLPLKPKVIPKEKTLLKPKKLPTSCLKVTLKNGYTPSEVKKYNSRVSPSYPAKLCQGKKMKGKSGQMYISKKLKNGSYRWVKVSKSPKKRSPKTYKNRKLGCVKANKNNGFTPSEIEKYRFRPSPPYPANQCKNKKRKGNSGDMYISKGPDKNGNYRWLKLKM